MEPNPRQSPGCHQWLKWSAIREIQKMQKAPPSRAFLKWA
jgi:hypothetical protein